MERTVHKTKNFQHADQWDIEQHRKMSSEKRQAVAKELKRRVYGNENPDVRQAEDRK